MTTITIRRAVPSANTFTNQRGFRGRMAYKLERNAWHVLMRAKLTPRHPPEGKVRIRLISYRNRLLDFGNLVGGAKPIPDILKLLGYIKDDRPKWFECDYQQHQVPIGEERTEIIFIDEVPA